MFLNIDKKKSDSLALVDNKGNRITYGTLAELMEKVGGLVEPRTVIFNLCKNTAVQ